MVLAEKQTHNQWNRIKSQEINPHTYGQFNHDTWDKNLEKGERTVSSINSVGETGQAHAKEWNKTTILHHIQKLTQNEVKTWP